MASLLKKRRPSTQYCCVVNCSNSLENTRDRIPAVKFYHFPGKEYEKGRREAWVTAVRRQRENGTAWMPNSSTRICSDHFVGHCKNDVESHPSYVPSIFPAAYPKKTTTADRRMRWLKRQSSAVAEHEAAVDECASTDMAPDQSAPVCLNLLADEPSLVTTEPLSTSQETQTDDDSTQGPLQLFLCRTDGHCGTTQVTHVEQSHKVTSTEGQWQRPCGFSGFSSLKNSEETMQGLCNVTTRIFTLLLDLLPDQGYQSPEMSKADKLTLFLVKLKLGISFTALGALFGVSESTASVTFNDVLDTLSVILKNFVFVPHREAIRDTMPDVIKLHYPNCIFIIDCPEIKTETPPNVEQRDFLYSHRKGAHILKFLVAVAPNGMVAFVSKLYGGCHGDSYVATDSGFLSLVKPGDVVLSDGAFPHMRRRVAERGAAVVMPPFFSGDRLSVEDAGKTYRVARVRMHVEMAIRRLKAFNILTNQVPISLIPHMSKVIHVCAAIVNLQAPVVTPK